MKTAIHHMVVLLCICIGAKVVSPDRMNVFNWLDRFLFNEYKKVIAEWPLLIVITYRNRNATF